VDGGERVYRIDDCTKAQVMEVIEMMKKNGVRVEKTNPDRAQTK
jgi:hypothetical protein